MTTDLSVIILSYNTLQTTKDCVNLLLKNLKKTSLLKAEVIIIDNASGDGSTKMIAALPKTPAPHIAIKAVFNKKNVGYPKGNNQGLRLAQGEYVLLLNSDLMIESIDFSALLTHLKRHPEVGALTVRVALPKGGIDPASHRGFPTLWNSFCYFLKLEKLFGGVPLLGRIFGGYHRTYQNLSVPHEIDSPAGAFYLSPRNILKQVGGFDDKNFFLYGEDLDLSYRIKAIGYKIMYYPLFTVTHLKRTSGLNTASATRRQKAKDHFYEAMKIFYRLHYAKRYPKLLNSAVYFFVDLKKKIS